jgi:hypothetical protein
MTSHIASGSIYESGRCIAASQSRFLASTQTPVALSSSLLIRGISKAITKPALRARLTKDFIHALQVAHFLRCSTSAGVRLPRSRTSAHPREASICSSITRSTLQTSQKVQASPYLTADTHKLLSVRSSICCNQQSFATCPDWATESAFRPPISNAAVAAANNYLRPWRKAYPVKTAVIIS